MVIDTDCDAQSETDFQTAQKLKLKQPEAMSKTVHEPKIQAEPDLVTHLKSAKRQELKPGTSKDKSESAPERVSASSSVSVLAHAVAATGLAETAERGCVEPKLSINYCRPLLVSEMDRLSSSAGRWDEEAAADGLTQE